VQVVSHSPEETLALGRQLAALLQPGDVILLTGELGTGKTELVRGLAAGLGLAPEQVSSPTFALVHEYPGRLPLIHVDLYRLGQLEEEFALMLEDYWQQPVVTVIEWAERLAGNLPEEYVEITLTWLDAQSRRLEAVGVGPRGEQLLRAWSSLASGTTEASSRTIYG
jgi:tRNA threonylcarbamoyladenosine biosynthesis protein TsaE